MADPSRRNSGLETMSNSTSSCPASAAASAMSFPTCRDVPTGTVLFCTITR